MKKLLFISLLFLPCFSFGQSTTVTSECNGNWTDPMTWDIGVPGISDTVIINDSVRLDTTVVINLPGYLYISSTGELCGQDTFQGQFIIDGPMSVGVLIVEGNSVNNVLLQCAGSIIMNGTWQQNAASCSGCPFVCTPFIPCPPPEGIEDNNTDVTISVYPNPTTGQFTVSSRQGAKEIQVYDLFGRLLLLSNEQEIDMSGYPAGLYIYRIGAARGKLVKE